MPAYELFSQTEILGRMALDRMLAGISTRRYPVALEPVGVRTETAATATSRSAGEQVAGGAPDCEQDQEDQHVGKQLFSAGSSEDGT